MTQFGESGPIPGAVHGKFVPGLPWDNLPAPVWELEQEEPDPLEEEIRRFNADLDAAYEAEQYAEDDASRARDDQRTARAEIDTRLEALAKRAPERAAAIKKELDL